MEQELVLRRGAHWTDSETVEPPEAVHEEIVRIEVEVPGVVRFAGVERTRPVAAVAASVVELVAPTVASGGQEKTVAVARREKQAIHIVLGCPSCGGILVQFPPLDFGRHAPATAPVYRGRVIFRLKDGQVVGEAVVTVTRVGAILGQLVVRAVGILVSIPVVSGLGLGFAPSVIVTVTLWCCGTHVAGGPQGAARKTEVDIGMGFSVAKDNIIILKYTVFLIIIFQLFVTNRTSTI